MIERRHDGPASVLTAAWRPSAWAAVLASPDDTVGPIRPGVALLIRVAALLGVFAVSDALRDHLTAIDLDVVQREGPLQAVVHSLDGIGWVALFMMLAALVRGRRVSWSRLEGGRRLRLLITAATVLLVWPLATAPYNYYADTAQLLDRALLMLAIPAVWWRPIAVLPFIVLASLAALQGGHPIGGHSVAEPFMLMRVLLACGAAAALAAVTAGRRTAEILFVIGCILAAHYLRPGLGKLSLNWITHGQVHWLLASTHANGWLGFLDTATIERVVDGVSWFDWPLRVATLTVELGGLLLFWRRATRAVVLAWMLFHVGVFALSGICFWKWVVFELVLFTLYLRPGAVVPALFTRSHLLLSPVVIAMGTVMFHPVNLSWFDTPACDTYRLEGLDRDGRRWTLPPQYFAPYDYQFTLGNFGYLIDAPHLGLVWGTTVHREVADDLGAARDVEDLLAVERRHGQSHYRPRRAARFAAFVRQFVAHRNRRPQWTPWWSWIAAPRQLWTFADAAAYDGSAPLTVVEVYRVTRLSSGEHIVVARRDLLATVVVSER